MKHVKNQIVSTRSKVWTASVHHQFSFEEAISWRGPNREKNKNTVSYRPPWSPRLALDFFLGVRTSQRHQRVQGLTLKLWKSGSNCVKKNYFKCLKVCLTKAFFFASKRSPKRWQSTHYHSPLNQTPALGRRPSSTDKLSALPLRCHSVPGCGGWCWRAARPARPTPLQPNDVSGPASVMSLAGVSQARRPSPTQRLENFWPPPPPIVSPG